MSIEPSCLYCGDTAGPFHLDHVVPRSRGGPDLPTNIVQACAPCNASKSDRLPSEWRSDLPARVLEIEAAVTKYVHVRVRSGRGPLPSAEPKSPPTAVTERRFPRLATACGYCQADLAAALSSTNARNRVAWLVWLSDSTTREVCFVSTYCGECRARLAEQLERSHERSYLRDMPLAWAAGPWAMPQLWRLLQDYRWPVKFSERLLDIMCAVQLLPDLGGHPEEFGA